MKNKYRIVGNHIEIELNRKKENTKLLTLIDLDDLNKIEKYDVTWFANWQRDIDNYYAEATFYIGLENSGKSIVKRMTLSRVIMDCPINKKVDHINSNTLDNRRCNLRIVSDSENSKNRKSKNSNNTSGYRNVTKIGKYWRVQLQVNKKNKLFPEKFEDVHEAGRFSKEMRNKYYGEFSGNG